MMKQAKKSLTALGMLAFVLLLTACNTNNTQEIEAETPALQSNGVMEEKVDVSDLVDNIDENLAESLVILDIEIPPHPQTQFDETYFLELLAGSISLTLNEKQNMVNKVPELTQEQINELIVVFENERKELKELNR